VLSQQQLEQLQQLPERLQLLQHCHQRGRCLNFQQLDLAK